MSVSQAMKRLMCFNLPRKPLISFSGLRVGMSSMALIFSGSTSIPRSLTMWPSNFPEVTPKGALLRIQSQPELSNPFKESL